MPRCLTPDDIVAEARTWIGTPWHPHAGVRGVGADCIGIHKGLAQAFGLTAAFPDEHIAILRAMDWYLHTTREWFHEAFIIAGFFEEIPIASRQPGDTLLFGFGMNPASHAGILSQAAPRETFIHADFQRCIVEAPLLPMQKRLRWVFRLKYEDVAV